MTSERPSESERPSGDAAPPESAKPFPTPAPRPGGTERIEKSWNPEKKSGQ